MATLNITLPDDLKSFLDTKIETAGYTDASEYILDLIEADQQLATDPFQVQPHYAMLLPSVFSISKTDGTSITTRLHRSRKRSSLVARNV